MKGMQQPHPVSKMGLENALEPLASYICAADDPADVLKAVWTALLNQVAETNHTAKSGIAHFLGHRTRANA